MKQATTILCVIISISNSCGQLKGELIWRFEDYTGLTFPSSGKVIEMKDNGFALEMYCSGVIEMDTLDYMKILQEVQIRNNSLLKNDEITYCNFVISDSEDEYASYEEHQDSQGRRFRLSFHRNKRIIHCIMESI